MSEHHLIPDDTKRNYRDMVLAGSTTWADLDPVDATSSDAVADESASSARKASPKPAAKRDD